MRRDDPMSSSVAFPRPGPGVYGVMVALGGIWLLLALAINWGPAPAVAFGDAVFDLGVGTAAGIARGELWRLATAALLHSPQGGAIVFNLLGFYFLGTSLESAWGTRRFVLFLLAAAVASYAFQVVLLFLLPAFATSRLAPGAWFGSLPLVEAIAIAWAVSYRGQVVRLFFVLPVSSRGLVIFVVATSAVAVVALEMPTCGLLAPFGGMLAGWLLGGQPMTVRRWWLGYRLRRHERELQDLASHRRRRAAASGLRVLPGGRSGEVGDGNDADSEPRGPRMLH